LPTRYFVDKLFWFEIYGEPDGDRAREGIKEMAAPIGKSG